MEKVDKLDIADEMLDGAIEEYLDHRRFMVSINLAGIAQELYGKALRIKGEKDSLFKIAESCFNEFSSTSDSDASIKEFKQISSLAKNGIKHFDSNKDRFLEINLKFESRVMIAIAINEHFRLNRKKSKFIERFIEFASIYYWYNKSKN